MLFWEVVFVVILSCLALFFGIIAVSFLTDLWYYHNPFNGKQRRERKKLVDELKKRRSF